MTRRPHLRRLIAALACMFAVAGLLVAVPLATPAWASAPVAAIATGNSHACSVADDGVLKCAGSNAYGQLGDGTTVDSQIPITVSPPGGTTFAAVTAGLTHTCALTTTGDAYCWGQGAYGRLGNGLTANSSLPSLVSLGGGLTFKSIDAGVYHTCGIASTDKVYCWGYNFYGAVGDGTTTNRSSPTAIQNTIDSNETFSVVKTGQHHSCGLTTAGAARCWGYNLYGQIGDTTTTTPRSNPTAVSGGLTFTSLAVGGYHTCGLVGTALHCWGYNDVGQIGDGTGTDRSSPVPISVAGMPLKSVVGGQKHTCAVTTAAATNPNAAYCWGYNLYGQVGDGSVTNRNAPVLVAGGHTFDTLDVNHHTCGITMQRAALCWGDNSEGQLGDGTKSTRFTPSRVWNHSFAMVSSRNYHSCGLTDTGVAYCWGRNSNSQLGDGTTKDRPTPVAVSGGLTFKWISAGPTHTCAVTRSDYATPNAAYCWGSGANGRLGDGTSATKAVPTAVLGGHTFKTISAGGGFSCGIRMDDTLYCWGYNISGQLGDGTTNQSTTPVGPAVSAATYFSGITTGNAHACAMSAGNTFCWGSDANGQVGDGSGSTADKLVPTQISTTFSAVTAGHNHSCGLSGTTASCWGLNADGQVGDSTTTDREAPTQVSGTVEFASLSSGHSNSCGLTAVGDAYCWGDNTYGQSGDNTSIPKRVPTAVSGGLAFSSISGGVYHTCGLLTTPGGAMKTPYCWGSNQYAQLGGEYPVDTVIPRPTLLLRMPVQAMAGASSHTCSLDNLGAAECSGVNSSGQLGDGTTANTTNPVAVAGGHILVTLATGRSHTCGLTAGGAAYCWGLGTSGQLGNGTTSTQTQPVAVAGGLNFKALSAGSTHTCGLTTIGQAYCWGTSTYGQVGDGTTGQRLSPTLVSGDRTYREISAGVIHTCGITTAGPTYCWGYNIYGGVGDGSTTQRNSPALVSGDRNYTSITAGLYTTCGLVIEVAYCWGYNSSGQVGIGTTATQTTPAAVNGSHSFKSVQLYEEHACGVTTPTYVNASVAYCWGENVHGNVGDNTLANRTAPVPVSAPGGIGSALTFTSLAQGPSYTTCGITFTGAAYCWGRNNIGQVGDATSSQRSTPQALSGGHTFKTVVAGRLHSCGLTDAGLASCWGSNSVGQLGDGTTSSTSVPVAVSQGALRFSSISVGASHTCAVTTAGSTPANAGYCWGSGNSGRLGVGLTTSYSVPTQVATGTVTQWKSISAGSSHSCGIAWSDIAYCWGSNSVSQLGDNTTSQRNSPTAVNGSPTFKSISAGGRHTCGINTSDVAFCWGYNSFGQVGDNSQTLAAVPTAITMPGGVASFTSVSAGYDHSSAIAVTSNVGYCWGYGSLGQIGAGNQTRDNLTPQQLNTTQVFASISAGSGDSTCAVTTGASTDPNAAYCWGYNVYAQLGDNTASTRTSPTAVSAGGSTYSQISSGQDHSCGLLTTPGGNDKTPYCWGYNLSGQLGGGFAVNPLTPTTTLFFNNQAPSAPTSLAQYKSDGSTSLATGAWNTSTSVVLKATVTDPDALDTTSICVEVEPVGTAFDGTDTACGPLVPRSTTASVTVGGLVENTAYHWQARTKDAGALYSSAWAVYGGNSDIVTAATDFIVDSVAPAVGTVFDGSITGVQTAVSGTALDTLGANWSGFSDGTSGIASYSYSIGTTAGATDVVGWTANALSTSATAGSLSLRTSQTYYFNVRATDVAGNTSTVVSSPGQVVSAMLTFAVGQTSVALDLNPGNGYTATSPIGFTTSTNAYNGYVVRVRASQNPTAVAGPALPNSFAGTWADPIAWSGSGFGYTSNDPLVTGTNRFNSGTEYAVVGTSGLGDVVADNLGPVVGASISDGFTSTIKAAYPNEAAGIYKTTVVLTAVPGY